MKLKKMALRGLIGLAVFVALCMFFSGTIESITTPKVKFAQPSRGKFEQKVELTGVLNYPETEPVKLKLPAGQGLTLTRVNVRPGYPVKAGDVVAEASITGYETALEQAQTEYNDALDALLELERKNSATVLRKTDQAYADAYAALRLASREMSKAKLQMDALMKKAGTSYSDSGYPEGADEALKAAVDVYREKLQARNAAQEQFDAVSRYGVDDAVWSYISEKQSAQDKIASCEDKIVDLQSMNAEVAQILAPHDGYIAEFNYKANDAYDGTAPLYLITPENVLPVLRADLSSVEQDVTEGMNVILTTQKYGDLETKISAIGFSESGERYADIALTPEIIEANGTLYNLAQQENKISLSFKAREATCLLPTSAVRGSEKERYVYVVNEESTLFGKKKWKLSKMDVKVLAEADGVTSIQEDLSYYSLANMEDRPISENSYVMAYEE